MTPEIARTVRVDHLVALCLCTLVLSACSGAPQDPAGSMQSSNAGQARATGQNGATGTAATAGGSLENLQPSPPEAAPRRIVASGVKDATCHDEKDCGQVTLPDGIALVGGCRLVARRGAVEAVVGQLDSSDGLMGDCPSLLAITVKGDRSLVVETSWKEQIEVTRAHMDSRLEHAGALALVNEKRPKDAARALERALALDPGYERAAFALARVRVGQGASARAARALAPFLAQRRYAIHARVLAETGLHPLLAHAPFTEVRARRPGKAVIADPTSSVIAFSSGRALYALVQRRHKFSSMCGKCFQTDLVVFDTTEIHAVIPILEDMPDTDQTRAMAELPGRLAVANRFLADLGFDPLVAERAAFKRERASGWQDRAAMAKGAVTVAFGEGAVRVMRGQQVLRERRIHHDCEAPRTRMSHLCDYEPSAHWVARIPSQDTLLVEWATSGAESYDIVTVIEIWPGKGKGKGGRAIMPQGASIPF